MGRNLNQIIAELPPERQERIEAFEIDAVDAVE